MKWFPGLAATFPFVSGFHTIPTIVGKEGDQLDHWLEAAVELCADLQVPSDGVEGNEFLWRKCGSVTPLLLVTRSY